MSAILAAMPLAIALLIALLVSLTIGEATLWIAEAIGRVGF